MGVWLTKVEHGASPMLLRHIEHNRVLHETVVLLTFVPDRRPRVPFHERHSVHRLGHGFYRIQVRLGFMQTPDIPLSLINCNKLGFDADLDHKNYYIAHETIVRRDAGSAMDPISFSIFSFLNRIASRAPDFFKNSARCHYRGGLSGGDLNLPSPLSAFTPAPATLTGSGSLSAIENADLWSMIRKSGDRCGGARQAGASRKTPDRHRR